MPAYSWSTAASGDWATGANWNPNGVPGAKGGDTATINTTGANYTVTYDETKETLNSLTINSAAATLVFNANETLTSSGTTTFKAGTIDLLNSGSTLNAGGLTTSSGTTINIATGGTLTYNSATIGGLVDMTGTSSFGAKADTIALSGTIEATSGTGTVTFAAISGTGTLEANGGTLLVASTLANATVEAVISNSASSVFETTGALFFGSHVPIQFLGAAGEFQYNDSKSDTSVHFDITGLNAGSSKTVPTNFVGLANEVVTITNSGTVFGTSGSVVLSNTDTLTLSGITGNLTKGWVAEAASDGHGGTEIFLASVCYAAGTQILTAAGERAVESLNHGDMVMTVVGNELLARPVKWLGRRRIDLAVHPRPAEVAPICIQRGALAELGAAPRSVRFPRPWRSGRWQADLCPPVDQWRDDPSAAGLEIRRLLPRRTGRPCHFACGRAAGGELPRHRQPRLLRQCRRAIRAASRSDKRGGLPHPRGGILPPVRLGRGERPADLAAIG